MNKAILIFLCLFAFIFNECTYDNKDKIGQLPKYFDCINPGDREENCHGLLEPIGIEISSKKGYVIVFRCQKCGAIRKNKSAEDDDMDLIISLSAKH